MSRAGAAEGPHAAADDFFLPDFCEPRMVLAIVLLSELLALTFALVRSADAAFLTELARLSFFLQWLGLTSAGLLCFAKRSLSRRTVVAVSLTVFGLLLANTVVVSELVYWLGRFAQTRSFGSVLFPETHWPFVARNAAISLIVTALLLRYLFVSHQWRRHVRAEALSRIHALQARIRPHFLFNSMNTIAALTRSDPARAEEAVEDLADLFRATLADSKTLLTIKEELELTRIYERIELLRLGDRLKVRWNIRDLPLRALIPGLTIQPLLENAIYHGIEPIDGGGTVEVTGRREDGRIVIEVRNPVAAERVARSGNRLAVENIRERIALAYGVAGGLEAVESDGEYRVTITLPYSE
jgi:two-component system sensor histidine kinase AlgZ